MGTLKLMHKGKHIIKTNFPKKGKKYQDIFILVVCCKIMESLYVFKRQQTAIDSQRNTNIIQKLCDAYLNWFKRHDYGIGGITSPICNIT